MVAMYKHSQWIIDTGISGKPRSMLLKALDACVQKLPSNNPSVTEIQATLVAFNAWADAKLQQGSVGLAPGVQPPAKARDGKGAFSKLLTQLYLAYLHADPMGFLSTYTLSEAGVSASSVRSMFAYPDASTQHAGVIAPSPWRNRLVITNTSNVSGQESIDVFNVRMIPKSEALDVGFIESAVLPANVDFMTTGQLSGCCFVACRIGGMVFAAHIQPRQGQAGVALKAAIDATGRFDALSLDQVHTFGAGDYGVGGSGYAMVVGVRHRDGWGLYGQDLGSSSQGPPINVIRIV